MSTEVKGALISAAALVVVAIIPFLFQWINSNHPIFSPTPTPTPIPISTSTQTPIPIPTSTLTLTPPTPTPSPTPTIPPTLMISTRSIIAANCPMGMRLTKEYGLIVSVKGYVCDMTLSITGQGSLNWTVSGQPQGVQISPQQGVLRSGQSAVPITIFLPVQMCPVTVTLTFTSQTNTGSVTLSC